MILRTTLIVLAVLAILILIIFLFIKLNPSFGGKPEGERLARIQKSPNYKDGVFQNPVPTIMQTDDMPFFKLMKEFLFAKGDRVPEKPIPVIQLKAPLYAERSDAARITWLGHSTLILEIDGVRILTDPIFGKRVSPFSFLGTKAFDFTHTYRLDELPPIDLVLISHDHYDHLDHSVMKQLRNQSVPFVTSLGVGSHLEYWGIDPKRITELDWGQSYRVSESLVLTATPARHFAGRGLTNRNTTLWSSWVIAGKTQKLFFGADSGYFPGFKSIGEQYGPFDLVMLECGQYSRYWPNIHMAPEETWQASLDLNAKAVMPIHWGKFKLSIHPWKEPVERILKAAGADSIRIATPRIGQAFQVGNALPQTRWWREME